MVKQAWTRPLAAVLVAGFCLAACSNSGKPSASSTSTTTTLPAITRETVVPLSVPNQDNVRKDVAMTNCAASTGGWSAGGAVLNTLGKTATYTITVFFTNKGYTDLAYAVTTVPLDAGKSKLWSAKATFAAPNTVRCVLRGVAAG
jgi:hypothetical protein